MTIRTLAALALILTAPAAARAQTCRAGWCRPAVVYRYSPPPSAAPRVVYARPQVSQVAVQPAPVAQVQTAAGDPYGFTAWLNAYRASHGVGAVVYDPSLDAVAATNNAWQAAKGIGHWYHTTLRQNAGMGAYAAILVGWTKSAGHNVALLDPAVRSVGIAGSGNFWTFVGN